LDVKHRRELWGLVKLLAKLSGTADGFGYCRCGIPPRLHQSDHACTLQIQLSPLTLDAFGNSGDEVQTSV
jgi:hypothetical protein